MSSEKRTFIFALLALLMWSSVTTITTIYYYGQYTETRKTFDELKSLVIYVNVLLDYGNGTQNWYNRTITQAGSTALDALLAVTTNVDYKMYSFGVLVTSINGVQNVVETPTTGRAWLWYYRNATATEWTFPLTGANVYILRPDDSIAWRYEGYS